MTLVGSELFSGSNNSKISAISNKNSALTGRNINFGIIGIINIDICSNIKDKILRVLTIIYIELLTFNRINNFNFKTILFIFKSIIIWIVFLLYCFWL